MSVSDYLARVLLLVGLCAPVIAQSPVEPPEYPAGQMCSPAGDVRWVPEQGWRTLNDHECHCHMQAMYPDECPDSPRLPEPKCLQFCHEKHCNCPVTCDMSHGDDHAHGDH